MNPGEYNSRNHTDKTHLRGLKNLNFSLVHAGGLCLCSSELYSPKTFQTSSYDGMHLNKTQNLPKKPYTQKLSTLFPVLFLKDTAC
jgi:hypothetical protein